jgi:ABC-type transport system involved in cytochrome bd biosynthesis fused ATPase/permease subunit
LHDELVKDKTVMSVFYDSEMAKEMDWVISVDQGKVELLSKTEFAQNTKEWLF